MIQKFPCRHSLDSTSSSYYPTVLAPYAKKPRHIPRHQHLPNIVEAHGVQYALPKVHGQDGEGCEDGADEVPDVGQEVLPPPMKTIKIKILRQPRRVHLGPRSLGVIVPVACEITEVSEGGEELAGEEGGEGPRPKNQCKPINLTEQPPRLK